MLTRRQLLASSALVLAPTFAYAERTDPLEDLSPLLDPIRTKYGVPALGGLLIRETKTAAIGVVGHRKLGGEVKATTGDRFHLGSCTKAMTATLCALAIEKELLKWETPLKELLPDLEFRMHPAYPSLTVEHLLNHQSGFSNETAPNGMTLWDLHRLEGTMRENRSLYMGKVLEDPPVHIPGTKFLYSNRNFVVLGAILERLMNEEWERLMQNLLFRPLKMREVGFGAMGRRGKEDQPLQHRVDGETYKIVEPGRFSDNPLTIGPTGLVHASLEDWARFILDHQQGLQGKPSLLKPEAYARLHQPGFGGNYAGGWGVFRFRNEKLYSHTGTNTMNYAYVQMVPALGLAFLAVCNAGGEKAENACKDVIRALQNHRPAV